MQIFTIHWIAVKALSSFSDGFLRHQLALPFSRIIFKHHQGRRWLIKAHGGSSTLITTFFSSSKEIYRVKASSRYVFFVISGAGGEFGFQWMLALGRQTILRGVGCASLSRWKRRSAGIAIKHLSAAHSDVVFGHGLSSIAHWCRKIVPSE